MQINHYYSRLTILMIGTFIVSSATACSSREQQVITQNETERINPSRTQDIQLTPKATSLDTNTLSSMTTLTPLSEKDYQVVTPSSTPVDQSEKAKAKTLKIQEYEYTTQMGDSLPLLIKRFNVTDEDIRSEKPLPQVGLIETGTVVFIPDKFKEVGPSQKLVPDGDIVYSPSALDFDIQAYLTEAGGFLADYWEPRGESFISGAQIMQAEAIDYSINPRIILSLIEQHSHLVTKNDCTDEELDYLLGWGSTRQGFSRQLDYAIRVLSTGYYQWREGSLKELTFPDGTTLTMAPTLNAGSAALQYYYAQQLDQDEWYEALYGEGNISQIHDMLFGDAWLREQSFSPLIPDNLQQPPLELPFQANRPWNYTSGPHSVWSWYGANGALDFAPAGVIDCSVSNEWITACAPGTVTRTQKGFIAVDLENDGNEQIGWTVIYMHVRNEFPLQVGDIIEQDDFLGYPSCEGGRATGTHLHIARKYNGEWILADGPVPFVLGGWKAVAGENAYEGQLVKGDEIITSSIFGEHYSKIIRSP